MEYNIKTKTSDKCRVYPDSPNGPQPSVTSITGCLMKYALVDWAANCAVDYLDKRIQVVEVDDLNIVRACWKEHDLFEQARTAHKNISEEAANTGTDVHELCSLWLMGQDTREAESKASTETLALWEAFKDWAIKNKLEVVHSELVLHGDGYSGRCDLIAYRTDPKTGKRVLGLYDIKTGKGSYYPEWGLQLAAYADAWEDMETTAESWPVALREIQEIGIIKLNKETLKCNFSEDRGPKFTDHRPRLTRAFMSLKDFYWSYNDLKTQFAEIQNGQQIPA